MDTANDPSVTVAPILQKYMDYCTPVFDGVAVLGAASKTYTFVFDRRHRFKVSDYTHY
jgi:hypothetical protein